MEKFKTKTDVAHSWIKAKILNGEYAPGKKLNPRAIAEQIHLSSVPVREAINKLATEGLVRLRPHLGATVQKIDYEDAIELRTIRTELECLSVKLSLDHMTEENRARLEQILEKSRQAIKEEDYAKFRKLAEQFHIGIFRDSSHQILTKMLLELFERLKLVWAHPWTKERAERDLAEHYEILDALGQRNTRAASALLRKHRKASAEMFKDRIQIED